MKLKTFKELIALSKEKFDEAMVPLRAATAKAKAQLLVAEIDEKIASVQQRIQEQAGNKDINFETLADLVDQVELLELRRKRFTDIVSQLFPEETVAGE